MVLVCNPQKGEKTKKKKKRWLQLGQIVTPRTVELTCFVFWGPKQEKPHDSKLQVKLFSNRFSASKHETESAHTFPDNMLNIWEKNNTLFTQSFSKLSVHKINNKSKSKNKIYE